MNPRLLALIPLIWIASQTEVRAGGILTRVGKGNPVCKEALNAVSDLSKADFYGGEWKKEFQSVELLPLDEPTLAYAIHDINNDGVNDLVVRQQGMFGSVDWDWFYVLKPDRLPDLKKENFWQALSSESAELSPRNSVTFNDGKDAVPVETHIWIYHGKSYLLMKENFFAKDRQKEHGQTLPNSFFVGQLLGEGSAQYDNTFKVRRLMPKMICRFTWR